MTDTRTLERLIGAVIAPEWRVGGARPSPAYLKRFPPLWVIAFGRSLQTRGTLPGLAAELVELRAFAARAGLPRPAVCCDLEEGAGLHFPEGTRLPPALALAAADLGSRAQRAPRFGPGDALFRAGQRTAREARALGVELVLAPVVDVNTRRDNPIIATRSFGDTPSAVAARARAWLEGLAHGGALGCLKHYPGHGDTEQDSHAVLPLVSKPRAELEACELLPFRELLASAVPGLGAVMIAHLDMPGLCGTLGLPTSLSERAVNGVLRGEFGWDGAVLTDGLTMGALTHLEQIHTRALNAGCDLLLGPPRAERAAEELYSAVRAGELSVQTLEQAAQRLQRLVEPSTRGAAGDALAASHAVETSLAHDLAAAAITLGPRGWEATAAARTELQVVHGPEADAVQRLAELQAQWLGRRGAASSEGESPEARRRVYAAACVVGCGRGRAGLDPAVERDLLNRIDRELERGRRAGLLWFGSPQVLPPGLWNREGLSVAILYSPAEPLQRAAAEFLVAARAEAPGRLPVADPD
jgi:beta-glucosidase-like glycosyl hydrolase